MTCGSKFVCGSLRQQGMQPTTSVGTLISEIQFCEWAVCSSKRVDVSVLGLLNFLALQGAPKVFIEDTHSTHLVATEVRFVPARGSVKFLPAV